MKTIKAPARLFWRMIEQRRKEPTVSLNEVRRLVKAKRAPKLSSYASRAKDHPLSLREIDKEVQTYRRSKH